MAQSATDRKFKIAQHRSSYPAHWYFDDGEQMPQSVDHVLREDRLAALLEGWKRRTNRDVMVGKELACRWDETQKRLGIDPDVYVVDMPPERKEGQDVTSLCRWKPGHEAPLLCIEVVSRSRPLKDYEDSPPRHDMLGTFELWVYDPDLLGGTKNVPPVRFQMFQRETNDELVRTYAGEGPAFSEALGAWVTIVEDESGAYDLVISNDRAGKDRWLTPEEEERKRADEAEQRAADAQQRASDAEKRADKERAEKEQALARLAELEAMLASRSK